MHLEFISSQLLDNTVEICSKNLLRKYHLNLHFKRRTFFVISRKMLHFI